RTPQNCFPPGILLSDLLVPVFVRPWQCKRLLRVDALSLMRAPSREEPPLPLRIQPGKALVRRGSQVNTYLYTFDDLREITQALQRCRPLKAASKGVLIDQLLGLLLFQQALSIRGDSPNAVKPGTPLQDGEDMVMEAAQAVCL